MSDFGGRLRQARERRGISLRQIATATKISVGALDALERNDVSKLPGGIFSRAFVRSYAVEVGLDPEQTVREFVERFHPEAAAQPEQDGETGAEERSFESRRRMTVVLVGLLVVSLPIVLFILWVGMRGRNDGASAEGPSGRQAAPPPVASEPEAAATAGPPAPPPASTTPPAASPVTLELQPSGPCWVSLTVDGQRVMSRLMQAGEREVRQVHQVAQLEVGDAGVFAFSINGRTGRSLGAAGERGQASITPQNYTSFVR
jgi:cytoskeletal protein RodZ